ncbi:hypothetical protein Bca4012_009017 [Brassica carinata]|uniref:Uncharacterized protein n=1 Tax=Brassica carinata TaxID=52824 RepID=A0A8X7V0M9_BRACI|nr:hypothetical protein Bca52824_034299 [Brassica carinata]
MSSTGRKLPRLRFERQRLLLGGAEQHREDVQGGWRAGPAHGVSRGLRKLWTGADGESGTARLVLLNRDLVVADGMARRRRDGTVVVVSQKKLWFLKSQDRRSGL